MKRVVFGILLGLIGLGLLIVWPRKLPAGTLPDTPPAGAQSGDIVFMQGRTFGARLQSLTRPIYGAYSHVGLLDRRPDGDYIIHATPAVARGMNKAGVILEPWDFMVTEERLTKVLVLSVAGADRAAKNTAIERARAYERAGTPFDLSLIHI